MDSEAARLLWAPDVLLYVDMGTRYSRAERARLRPDVEVVELRLAGWERPDGIIPGRNLHLVTLASSYGSEVGLAAAAGDRVLDKSPEFAHQASELLSYLWQPQHWTEGKTVTVVLPVKHLTKRGMLAAVFETHGDHGVDLLARSFSCYRPVQGWECGVCKPCVRKWIAFAASGRADQLGEWRHRARTETAATTLPAIADGTYGRAGEAIDVLAAYGVHVVADDQQAAAAWLLAKGTTSVHDQ